VLSLDSFPFPTDLGKWDKKRTYFIIKSGGGVFELFAKTVLYMWLSKDVVRDKCEGSSGWIGSSAEEGYGLSGQTGRMLFRFRNVASEEVMKHGRVLFSLTFYLAVYLCPYPRDSFLPELERSIKKS
jgi:hypothetical protein